jgi:hypothetical protein
MPSTGPVRGLSLQVNSFGSISFSGQLSFPRKDKAPGALSLLGTSHIIEGDQKGLGLNPGSQDRVPTPGWCPAFINK